MVRGLDIFTKYFENYSDNYVIIGGTACDILIEEAGFIPRATKDIDIILIVEALNTDFVKQFWQFVTEGNYERKEKSDDERKYYRFVKPENLDFPFQLELFARNPDLLDLEDGAHMTPIPVEDDLSSLSAILLNDTYYHYMIEHSELENGIRLASNEALICLKARAFLDITERISKGGKEDKKHIRKHKGDIFRLAVMLTENNVFSLPKPIYSDMQSFANAIVNNLPDKQIFKAMGLSNTNPKLVYHQIRKSFQLGEE
jgi:hypothetical protein